MYQNLHDVLSRELSGGEKLLWGGKPISSIRLRQQDAFLIPFSLLWGGFAFFWEASVIRSKAPFFFQLWGIPLLVLLGLYLIVGRFIVDSKLRAKTFYGVTNQRILILTGLFSRNLRSLNLKTLSEVNLSEKSDGSGMVFFGPVYPMARFSSAGWPGARRYAPPAFDLIEHARETYEIIRQAQSDSAK